MHNCKPRYLFMTDKTYQNEHFIDNTWVVIVLQTVLYAFFVGIFKKNIYHHPFFFFQEYALFH